ncbi:hypothetical protein [Ferruginibacter sp. SUN106]|uniref:hypothetical protein n=1 Tax=Ferruginibacter sp. SUN106 TaxID=2978348 RepID=UPI003D36D942
MSKESVLGIFEKIIAPFHNMSIVITAFSALSIHALLTNFFEPLIHLYYTLLLTFPLTAGLLVVFLILYNTNWKKITIAHIVLSPLPVALLFMLLTGISEKYGLEKMGKHEQEEKKVAEHKIEKKDSLAPVSFAPSTKNASANPYEGMQGLLKKMQAADSTAQYRQEHPAWYEKTQLTRNLAWAIGFIWQSFIKMYNNYGPTRFISGVLLALFLTWYIQTKAINKITAGPKKASTNEA